MWLAETNEREYARRISVYIFMETLYTRAPACTRSRVSYNPNVCNSFHFREPNFSDV